MLVTFILEAITCDSNYSQRTEVARKDTAKRKIPKMSKKEEQKMTTTNIKRTQIKPLSCKQTLLANKPQRQQTAKPPGGGSKHKEAE